jgi:hypothetical protein
MTTLTHPGVQPGSRGSWSPASASPVLTAITPSQAGIKRKTWPELSYISFPLKNDKL